MNKSNLEPLITDRTAQDVSTGTKKGFYNVSDVQRVNSYIQYLSEELGLNLNVYEFFIGEILTREQMNDIIDNVNTIRASWYVSSDTPQTPIAVNWDYIKANNLEKILFSLNEFYQSKQIDKIYSGTFRAGRQVKFRGAK